ncbi:SDR family NAD(P)-dependent oxidoreductase, partial [Flavonifractor plautii]|uniref:SDR family NAD(P)-dependent oxidoreductase n=1 Tax=Flavonifractor plautii TaxID=292800 RepID=UPI003D7C8A75
AGALAKLQQEAHPIALLVLNAGVAGARGLTRDGFELAFGVNHVGHFLLVSGLAPLLHQAGRARIVTVASRAHFEHRSIDWTAVREPTRTR